MWRALVLRWPLRRATTGVVLTWARAVCSPRRVVGASAVFACAPPWDPQLHAHLLPRCLQAVLTGRERGCLILFELSSALTGVANAECGFGKCLVLCSQHRTEASWCFVVCSRSGGLWSELGHITLNLWQGTSPTRTSQRKRMHRGPSGVWEAMAGGASVHACTSLSEKSS